MKKIKKKNVIGAVCLLAPLATGVYLIRRHKKKNYAKAI
jgi:hypothetical protein